MLNKQYKLQVNYKIKQKDVNNANENLINRCILINFEKYNTTLK